MNGVKEKFKNDEVQSMFAAHDILVVMETHFNVRHKCPDYFSLVGRSAKFGGNTGRGGVAIYVKDELSLNFRMFDDVCPDAVVLEIIDTDIVVIAPYIVPDNSKYKIDYMFPLLDFIIKNFKRKCLYIMGDLNARCATPANTMYHYAHNPDEVINSNGRKVLSICSENNLIIVNGLQNGGLCFDSNFTFHRGQLRSQNDWLITNNLDSVASFKILPKMVLSDHLPCSILIRFNTLPTSLTVLEKCSGGNFNYDCHDRSTLLKPKIRLHDVDCSPLMVKEFNCLAQSITDKLQNEDSVDDIAQMINNEIYSICKKFSSRRKPRITIPDNKANCSSKNFMAIAEANLKMYSRCIENSAPEETAMNYLMTWRDNIAYANECEQKEYNTKRNHAWKHVAKDNPRKMWKIIDYKDKETKLKQEIKIKPQTVQHYFKGIFQADHLSEKPTVKDIRCKLDDYDVTDEQLDQDFSFTEFNDAILSIGRGIGVDGLDKKIAHLFPQKLRLALLEFSNVVFHDKYPEEWCYQILRPEVKKGHTIKNPKLRGVALSSLLASIYDIMIDDRFKPWYKVNPEQAGFRELMGCLIQIFALYLLMELARSKGETLFIGFIDYEKAFDFVNRYDIVDDLMNEKAGSTFTKAVANMYERTYYVPKVSPTRKGEAIESVHGVTQGRKSSTSLFSFAIRNIPKAVKLPESFLDGHHVFQLADDATVNVDSIMNLTTGFGQIIDASEEKFMVTNMTKTFYLHLCDDPFTEAINLYNGKVIKAAENNLHIYLGMWFKTTADITEQMKCNLDHRGFNIKKFYDWLDVNAMTPIIIKLCVMDACMFAAYLYGCECWSTIDKVEEKLLAIERKLLKTILQVKPSTPNAIVYTELGRCDRMSMIKARQKRFYTNCKKLTEEEAVMRCILELCKDLDIVRYYENLSDGVDVRSREKMKNEILGATSTHCERYRDVTDVRYVDSIYGQFLREDKRVAITKWRLSSHDLHVEKGRYTSPITPREERTCSRCLTCVEDENHVLFLCPLYESVRVKFRDAFLKLNSVHAMLNPIDIEDANMVGDILLNIDKIRKVECP